MTAVGTLLAMETPWTSIMRCIAASLRLRSLLPLLPPSMMNLIVATYTSIGVIDSDSDRVTCG
jgi:hypothetical protein